MLKAISRSLLSRINTQIILQKAQLSSYGLIFLKIKRIVKAPKQYILRRAIGQKIQHSMPPLISKEQGYLHIKAETFPNTQQIIQECREILELKRPTLEFIFSQYTGKKRLLTDLLSDKDLERYPNLVDFALSTPVLDAVTAYFGYLPLLRRVGIYISTPQALDSPAYSQLFHYDHGDYKQLKFFFNIYDIDESKGPFTLLPAPVSRHVCSKLKSAVKRKLIQQPEVGRYTDADVFKFCKEEDLVKSIGAAGSGIAVDTSRCLHYGSRIQQGERLCFFMHFVGYHYTASSPSNYFNPERYLKDFKKLLAISPEEQYPFGHFFPDYEMEHSKTVAKKSSS